MGKVLTFALLMTTAAATVLTGCSTSGCIENQSSLPLAGFYSSGNEQGISLSTVEVYGIGAPGDSVLYPAGRTLSEIYMPFRSTSEQTAYCFHYTQESLDDDALNDTITFGYTSTPYFASEECGAMLTYRIRSMSHTNHLIDSVAIVDSLITNSNLQRIKIFFRTNTSSNQ